MDTIRVFFSKIRTLFLIFKKRKESPPLSPPSWAPAFVGFNLTEVDDTLFELTEKLKSPSFC